MSYGPGRVRSSSLGSLLIIVGVALVTAWLVQLWLNRAGPLNDPNAAPRVVAARGDLAEDEKATIELFKQASRSVVHITTLVADRFNLDATGIPAGSGSGFIWDDQGHVVTNFHVIRKANIARVTLNDNTTYEARLTGAAPDADLAVLKIDTPGKTPPAIPVGTSHDLSVGQKVFAIGNPFGLDQTLTTGIISALGRRIQSENNRWIEGVVQTDAAINPGNSGGPLLDSAGRLIGVNTQIISPSGAYAGIGFAIPVDTVNTIVPELIRNGEITRPSLGVEFVDDAIARRLGVRRGVMVQKIDPDSSAEKAGLRPTRRLADGRIVLGDIVQSVDGVDVATRADLWQILARKKVGDQVNLGIQRGRQQVEVTVTLQPG